MPQKASVTLLVNTAFWDKIKLSTPKSYIQIPNFLEPGVKLECHNCPLQIIFLSYEDNENHRNTFEKNAK